MVEKNRNDLYKSKYNKAIYFASIWKALSIATNLETVNKITITINKMKNLRE